MTQENNQQPAASQPVAPNGQNPTAAAPANPYAADSQAGAQQQAPQPGAPGTQQQAPQPSAPGTQRQVNNTDSKATGALVCGILSILLSFSVFISIVLGIVAIVLASQVAKQAIANGRAKAGKVCGIVGIVLSVLSVIIGILLVVGLVSLDKSGQLGSVYNQLEQSSAVTLPNDEKSAVKEAASRDMEGIQTLDASDRKTLAKSIDSNFENLSGVSLSAMGVDSNDLVSWLVDGMSYSIESVDVQGSTATAYITVNSRDVDTFMTEFENGVDAYTGSDAYKNATSVSDVYKQFGDIMKASMGKAGMSEKMTYLDYTKSSGTWTVDESSLEGAAADTYGLNLI